MIKALVERYAVDINASFMIGDKQSDLAAAQAAGIAAYLFDGSNLHTFIARLLTDWSYPPDQSRSHRRGAGTED